MLWLLYACNPSPFPEMAEDAEDDEVVLGDDDDDDDDDHDSESLLDPLLSGEVDLVSFMDDVTWGDGLPVRDGKTFAFVLPETGGKWSIAGDFNDWEPEVMEAGDGFWWFETTIDSPEGGQYKFVDAQGNWYADPYARAYTYDAFGEASYVVPSSTTWHLERWPSLAAEGLAPRDLRVYVPAGSGPWPVLYVHDGQNLFDPASMFGGWRLQEALADREPMLVVGIDNTGFARMDEYTHVQDDIGDGSLVGGQGDAYAALVHDHVRPHVEQVYGSTGIDGQMGSSLGGLIALHIVNRYPGEYDFVAGLSSTLGWGVFGAVDRDTMEDRFLATGPRSEVVYVDSGGDTGPDGLCQDLDGDGFPEDDPDSFDNFCETRQFADALAASGWTWDATLYHWHEDGAPHNELAWADRVWRPLSIFEAL